MDKMLKINQVKLIVFDIDGTLLDSEHSLQPQTRDVLRQLKARKIPVTLATGKNWDAVQPLADELQIDVPLILANGAIIKMRNGEGVAKSTLPVSATRCIIDICEHTGIDLSIYLDDDVYVKEITHNLSLLQDYGSPGLVEVGDWQAIADRLPQVHKCQVVERNSRHKLFDFERILRAEIGDEIDYCHSLIEMFEMMPKGVSKENALLKICDLMRLNPDAVIAFGDGNNDAGMLAAAGLGVAVADAFQAAKASADLVVASCDRSGPAEFLDYLLNDSNSN